MRTNAILLFLAAACGCAAAQPVAPDALPAWWVKLPHPKVLYVTGNVDGFAPMFEGDCGGGLGAAAFLVESLSGLAALSVAEERGDAMVWMNLPNNPSYALWLEETVKRTGAGRVEGMSPIDLVRHFHDVGVVKGYILYSADTGRRNPFDAVPKDGTDYNNSVNVATSLAAGLGAVIIDARAEPKLKELGLACLFDARDRDEQWFFDKRRDECTRKLVHIVDPKVPHLRGYCIATRSICIFGTGKLTEDVFRWLEPNAPVIGWNGGDENVMTSQFSRFGHFHTASNWCLNLPAISTVRAGGDVPWDALRVNAMSSVDPLDMDWPANTHFTSFITTDGDNVQWAMGDFLHSPSYWASPARGTFPMGWTFPADQLSQIAPQALAQLARTQTRNDQVVMFGGGYMYPDEYGRDCKDREAVLLGHIDQYAARMAALNVRVLCVLAMDWDGDAARRAYELYAARIPGLTGIFALQYYPYNGGLGRVLWVNNADGAPIPVISARYALWNNMSKVEKNGPPALVADLISRAPRDSAADPEGSIDWVSAHAWSFFRKADTSQDLLAEEMDQEKAARDPGARRGLEPVQWCVDRLAPQVRVVTPEEIAWRMRLCAKPKETLAALARELSRQPDLPGFTKDRLRDYQERLSTADLSSPDAARNAFVELRAIRFALSPMSLAAGK